MIEEEIIKHAIEKYPEEACGVIIEGEYIPCINRSKTPLSSFKIEGTYLIKNWDKIESIVHSHPNQVPPEFSEKDIVQMKLMPFKWVLVGLKKDETKQVKGNTERFSRGIIWGNT